MLIDAELNVAAAMLLNAGCSNCGFDIPESTIVVATDTYTLKPTVNTEVAAANDNDVLLQTLFVQEPKVGVKA